MRVSDDVRPRRAAESEATAYFADNDVVIGRCLYWNKLVCKWLNEMLERVVRVALLGEVVKECGGESGSEEENIKEGETKRSK